MGIRRREVHLNLGVARLSGVGLEFNILLILLRRFLLLRRMVRLSMKVLMVHKCLLMRSVGRMIRG